jgi:uncharacterized protein YpmS
MNYKIKFILFLSLAFNISLAVFFIFNRIIKKQPDKADSSVIKDYDSESINKSKITFYDGMNYEVKGKSHQELGYKRLPIILLLFIDSES